MKRSERWRRLYYRWSVLFSAPYRSEILDECDGEPIYGPNRERALKRTLVVGGPEADDVVDEMVGAVRWFIPHVRAAKLDPIPLRRLLGWLETWEAGAVDFSDGIALAAEARFLIDEAIDVVGEKIDGADEADEGEDVTAGERRRILDVLAASSGPMSRSEIEQAFARDWYDPGSKSTVGRRLGKLREKGLVHMKREGPKTKYLLTEAGSRHRIESRQFDE